MDHKDILRRLTRINAAIADSVEHDMTMLPAKRVSTPGLVGFCQDFSGQLSQADLENRVHMVIANVGSLLDHVKKWAEVQGKTADEVVEVFRGSHDLKIIQDLWNRDKHGGDPRNPWSGRKPRLQTVTRYMELTTKPEKGSWVFMTLGSKGTPEIHGDGNARCVISARVVDEDESDLGDIFEFIERGVKYWEDALRNWGLRL
jgi:hypothetical protein